MPCCLTLPPGELLQGIHHWGFVSLFSLGGCSTASATLSPSSSPTTRWGLLSLPGRDVPLQRGAQVGTTPNTAPNPSPTHSTRGRSHLMLRSSTALTYLPALKPPKASKRHQALTTGHCLAPEKTFFIIFNLFTHFNLSSPSFAAGWVCIPHLELL